MPQTHLICQGRPNLKVKEITTIKPLTPEQARVKALQAQADRAKDAVKAEKARQKIAKAQKNLSVLKSR